MLKLSVKIIMAIVYYGLPIGTGVWTIVSYLNYLIKDTEFNSLSLKCFLFSFVFIGIQMFATYFYFKYQYIKRTRKAENIRKMSFADRNFRNKQLRDKEKRNSSK